MSSYHFLNTNSLAFNSAHVMSSRAWRGSAAFSISFSDFARSVSDGGRDKAVQYNSSTISVKHLSPLIHFPNRLSRSVNNSLTVGPLINWNAWLMEVSSERSHSQV